jgi:EamA domain-containing membrane protein RarD
LSFLVVGVLGLIPASAFLAWGVDRSTASNAAIIYLTVPIITALLASVMLKERMTPVRWGSLFVDRGVDLVGFRLAPSATRQLDIPVWQHARAVGLYK